MQQTCKKENYTNLNRTRHTEMKGINRVEKLNQNLEKEKMQTEYINKKPIILKNLKEQNKLRCSEY